MNITTNDVMFESCKQVTEGAYRVLYIFMLMLLRHYAVVVGMNNYCPINLMQYPNIKLTVESNLDHFEWHFGTCCQWSVSI